MVNAYVSLDIFKSSGAANITGTGYDTRLLAIIEAVSRAVDDYVGRRLYPRLETIYFGGNGSDRMLLPDDLVSVTTLKEDEDLDGATYEETWASTDYVLAPYEVNPTLGDPDRAAPYYAIEVNRLDNGTRSRFGRGQRRFELLATWGWAESLKSSGATVNETYSASDTTLTVSSGAAFDVGETIKIESEYVYVTAISTNDLTVQRGVNGSTAAAHASGTAISIVQYPSPVREAAIVETARLWTMRSSGYASSIGNPETGVVQVFGGQLHPRARALLDPFRRVGL